MNTDTHLVYFTWSSAKNNGTISSSAAISRSILVSLNKCIRKKTFLICCITWYQYANMVLSSWIIGQMETFSAEPEDSWASFNVFINTTAIIWNVYLAAFLTLFTLHTAVINLMVSKDDEETILERDRYHNINDTTAR